MERSDAVAPPSGEEVPDAVLEDFTPSEEVFVHGGYASSRTDALLHALAPRTWTAPVPWMEKRPSWSEAIEMCAKVSESKKKTRTLRKVTDWDVIVPSYLAARRAAGRVRGWVPLWLERHHPHPLEDHQASRQARASFERALRRKAAAYQGV
jgi:hypothetical protein